MNLELNLKDSESQGSPESLAIVKKKYLCLDTTDDFSQYLMTLNLDLIFCSIGDWVKFKKIDEIVIFASNDNETLREGLEIIKTKLREEKYFVNFHIRESESKSAKLENLKTLNYFFHLGEKGNGDAEKILFVLDGQSINLLEKTKINSILQNAMAWYDGSTIYTDESSFFLDYKSGEELNILNNLTTDNIRWFYIKVLQARLANLSCEQNLDRRFCLRLIDLLGSDISVKRLADYCHDCLLTSIPRESRNIIFSLSKVLEKFH